ncbi:MAG: universal stress protein [Acidobacteria bacterium]|nr:universal stress protein [Acidobacteriota bacterium]
MKLRHLVFPTDFTPGSAKACRLAVDLARRFEAEVSMLHVFHHVNEEHLKHSFSWLLAQGPLFTESAVHVTPEFVSGTSPEETILEFARENQADLLVMATQGPFQPAYRLGSITERVLRYAPCPVLTVGSEASGSSLPVKRILIAFDFSENSRSAARYAQEMAASYGAEMHVFHVFEERMQPPYFQSWHDAHELEVPLIVGRAREFLIQTMDKENIRGKAEVEFATCAGHKIVQYASECGIDLVVMGAKGYTSSSDVLLGGTTARVIRTAPCPVLTFKTKPLT